jgi:hypothetical protein
MKKNVFLMILFTCFFVIFSYELSIKGIDFNNLVLCQENGQFKFIVFP